MIILVENEHNQRILLEAAIHRAGKALELSPDAYTIDYYQNRQPEEVQRYMMDYPGPLLLALDIFLDTDIADADRLLKDLVNSYMRLPDRLTTGPRRALVVYSNAREIIRSYQSQQSNEPPIFIVPKYGERDRDSRAELHRAFTVSLDYLQRAV